MQQRSGLRDKNMINYDSDFEMEILDVPYDRKSSPLKRMPGESAEEAAERINKVKELKRIQKLVRYAYPRQRESYVYKKKLLGPDSVNVSIDLYKLKRIKLEQDKMRQSKENLDIEGQIETAGHEVGDAPPETGYL